MSRRDTTPEERSLFHSAFRETRPLANAKTAPSSSKPIRKDGAQHNAAPGGLDGRTSERLRRGSIEPDVRIDLHGLTEAVAHSALLKTLRSAHKQGRRLVLVVTGKGGASQFGDRSENEVRERPRGVLKNIVPRWLSEPEFASLVAGTKSAHRRHGGEGALYVYLRKIRK